MSNKGPVDTSTVNKNVTMSVMKRWKKTQKTHETAVWSGDLEDINKSDGSKNMCVKFWIVSSSRSWFKKSTLKITLYIILAQKFSPKMGHSTRRIIAYGLIRYSRTKTQPHKYNFFPCVI